MEPRIQDSILSQGERHGDKLRPSQTVTVASQADSLAEFRGSLGSIPAEHEEENLRSDRYQPDADEVAYD